MKAYLEIKTANIHFKYFDTLKHPSFSLCDGYKARLVLANQHRLYVADRKSLIGLTQLNELAHHL